MLLKILVLGVVIVIIAVFVFVLGVVLPLGYGVSRPFDSMPISHVHGLNGHCASHLRGCSELEPFPDGWGASAQLLLLLPRLQVPSRFECIVSIFVVESEKRRPFPPALVRYWLSTCRRRRCAVVEIGRVGRYALGHLVRHIVVAHVRQDRHLAARRLQVSLSLWGYGEACGSTEIGVCERLLHGGGH